MDNRDGTGSAANAFGAPPSLRDYLRILRRGLWIIGLATVVAAGSAYYFSQRQQHLYQASADVVLSMQNLPAELSNVALPSGDPAREVATQAKVARTPVVAAAALRLAQLGNRSAANLLNHSSVQSTSNANLLTFVVTDPSRATASALATAYARAYTAYRSAFDTRAIVSARLEVQRQLQQTRAAGGSSSALYASLSEKAQQLRTMELLQGSNATVVRTAGEAAQIQPSTTRNTILGLVLGLLLGTGLVFLREALNTRVRNSEEIAERLDLPLLARIPEPSRQFRRKNRLEMLGAPNARQNESYHSLATNLEFANHGIGAKSILITSAGHSEGKSTVTASLAVALARGGKHVVLVDLDLRRPNQGNFFDLNSHRGLTEVLINRMTLEEALVPVAVVQDDEANGGSGPGTGSLIVVPAGVVPPNPAELVRGELLRSIIDGFRDWADFVLLDVPPILGPSDTMTLCGKADGLIVVARLPNLKRPLLAELRRVLDAAPIAKLGFVVTGAEVERNYGYGYGYAAQKGARKTKGEREILR